MDDQNAMLVEPAFQFVKQVTAVGPTCQAFFQPTHDIPALVLCHRPESERLICEDLMINERASTRFIQCPQRTEIGRIEFQLRAKVIPEHFGNLPVGVECTAAHPDKADVERDGKPVQVAATRLNQGALLRREGEERGKVEVGEFARDLPDAKISDLPVFHRARLEADDGPVSIATTHDGATTTACTNMRQP